MNFRIQKLRESKYIDDKYHHVVFTTFFTTKDDPQKDIRNDNIVCENNNFNYMKDFYESIQTLDATVFIFHDNLSQNFIDTYTTHKVKFVAVHYDSPLSINDERFVQYYYFLQLIDADYVTLLDISDVTYISNMTELYEKYDLCIGSDSKKYIIQSKYMKTKLQEFADNITYNPKPKHRLLNAGVIGGVYKNMMIFLKHGIEIWESIKHDKDFSMVVVNVVLHKLHWNLCVGYPYTSEFKKYETRNDVMFKHK